MARDRKFKEITSPEWIKPFDKGVVEGQIIAFKDAGEFGPSCTILVDGIRLYMGLTTILAQKITPEMVGRFIRVTSLGMAKPEKGGRPYQDYKVEVEEREGADPSPKKQDPF